MVDGVQRQRAEALTEPALLEPVFGDLRPMQAIDPSTQSVNQLVADPEVTTERLKLLWVSCGDRGTVVGTIPYSFHLRLEQKKVPHIWHQDSGGHGSPVWKNDLYLFSQLIFRDVKAQE